MDRTIVRKRMRFFGFVQGVGFRYRALYASRAAGATGWVRNEPDGSVTMELQGTAAQIESVLQAIEQGRWIRIEDVETGSVPVDPEERGFSAR